MYAYMCKVLSRHRKTDHTCVYDQRRIGYIYIYIIKSGYKGGDKGDSPPPLSLFRGGTVPPLRIVPRLSDSGGGQQKSWKMSPPLSDSGGGQIFSFRYFHVNSS